MGSGTRVSKRLRSAAIEAPRIFGRLDCGAALRAIACGGYVRHRVFFADAASATTAGYRPCAVCMPDAYQLWKERRAEGWASTWPRDRPSRMERLRQQPGRCAGTGAPTWLIVALIAGVLAVGNRLAVSPALVARRSKPQELLRTQ